MDQLTLFLLALVSGLTMCVCTSTDPRKLNLEVIEQVQKDEVQKTDPKGEMLLQLSRNNFYVSESPYGLSNMEGNECKNGIEIYNDSNENDRRRVRRRASRRRSNSRRSNGRRSNSRRSNSRRSNSRRSNGRPTNVRQYHRQNANIRPHWSGNQTNYQLSRWDKFDKITNGVSNIGNGLSGIGSSLVGVASITNAINDIKRDSDSSRSSKEHSNNPYVVNNYIYSNSTEAIQEPVSPNEYSQGNE